MLRSIALALLLTVGAAAANAQEATAEAPALAALVASGQLPPVAERVSNEPLVIEPTEEVGTYGGTWRLAMNGVGDRSSVMTALYYEPLLRWLPDASGTTPNVAKAVDVSSDSRVFTVHLREGMKWSDGEPFTADDFLFWYNDILNDPTSARRRARMARAGRHASGGDQGRRPELQLHLRAAERSLHPAARAVGRLRLRSPRR